MRQASEPTVGQRIVIIGATSAIAVACARRWAARGARFFLVARNAARLEQVAQDLLARGAAASARHVLDANSIEDHATMLEAAFSALGEIDTVLIAHGTLSNQAACEQDAALTLREFSTNAVSVVTLLTALALRMERQGRGAIAVISSVAGERGRRSNYVYGAAKAAVTTFCEGLRARLFRAGVQLTIVKPGFVDTPMTAGLRLPRALLASPDRVARDIVAAIDKRRDRVYTPWFWVCIMAVIRNIPEPIFKRMPL